MTGNDDAFSNPPADAAAASEPKTSRRSFGLKKIAVLLTVVVVFAMLFSRFRDQLTLETLAASEEAILTFGKERSVLVVLVYFAIYVAATALSLPGALVLTLAGGWFFAQLFGPLYGVISAVVFISFASTLGATLAFLLSRFLFREVILEKFGTYLSGFNAALEREGAFYLFTLRLIPQVPFFVINAVMGLTPLRVRTFWWVSQLGMLAGTVVYVYAGSAIPSLSDLAPALEEKGIWAILRPPIFVAFLLLGIFPIAVKKIMARVRRVVKTTSD